MRFKTDENLPIEIINLLRQQGHDALSVVEQQLAGHPDRNVAAVCRSERRVLITLDLDFSDVRAYPPEDYSGIVVLRPGLQTISSILRLMERALKLLDDEPLTNQLWIVDDHQVRIRGGHPPPSP